MVLSRDYRCGNKLLLQCSKLEPFCFIIIIVAVIICMFIHLDVFGFGL